MKNKVYTTILEFYKRYRQYPNTGFLAGIHKCTMENIRLILIQLEKEKKITRITKKEKFTKYKLYEKEN